MKLLTTTQVAEMLSVPAATLRWWRARGEGPDIVRLGGRVKYDLEAVERFVNDRRATFTLRAAARKVTHGTV